MLIPDVQPSSNPYHIGDGQDESNQVGGRLGDFEIGHLLTHLSLVSQQLNIDLDGTYLEYLNRLVSVENVQQTVV